MTDQIEFSFRRFPKIRRLAQEEIEQTKYQRPTLLDQILSGQPFYITEKLDGANSGIELIKHNGKLEYRAFSHNNYLDQKNDLREFYDFAKNILVPKLSDYFASLETLHVYLYGEWLVPHAVKYLKPMYNHWYLFSVYDALNKKEYSLPELQDVSKQAQILMPDVFVYTSRQSDSANRKAILVHYLESFVGKSMNTRQVNRGEGIVVKSGKLSAKLKAPEFQEVKRQKKDKNKIRSASEQFIESTATDARIEKILLKFQDEQKLPELSFNNFVKIVKPLIQATYDDLMIEEGNNRPDDWDETAAKHCLNRQVSYWLRNYIKKQEDQILK